MKKEQQITLEEATLILLSKIEIRTEERFAEKWKGKTDMVFEIAMPVIVLSAFDMEEKLPEKYKTFEPVIKKEYHDLILEMGDLVINGAMELIKKGLNERQAIAETKVQIFQGLGKKIPSAMAIEIIHLVGN